MSHSVLSALAVLVFAAAAHAGPDDFGPGPLIDAYGRIAPVDVEMDIPVGTEFKVAFDVAAGADRGELNRTLTSAARFLNMHVAHGVPAADIRIAVIVHGSAVRDVSGERIYSAEHGDTRNANAALIEILQEFGVRIIVCGQSAAWYGVDNDDLLPGVDMALSAMTAHALLQQDGYSLNSF